MSLSFLFNHCPKSSLVRRHKIENKIKMNLHSFRHFVDKVFDLHVCRFRSFSVRSISIKFFNSLFALFKSSLGFIISTHTDSAIASERKYANIGTHPLRISGLISSFLFAHISFLDILQRLQLKQMNPRFAKR